MRHVCGSAVPFFSDDGDRIEVCRIKVRNHFTFVISYCFFVIQFVHTVYVISFVDVPGVVYFVRSKAKVCLRGQG